MSDVFEEDKQEEQLTNNQNSNSKGRSAIQGTITSEEKIHSSEENLGNSIDQNHDKTFLNHD